MASVLLRKNLSLKLALPKGRLQAQTADFITCMGWGLEGYGEGSRRYCLSASRLPYLQVKVFQEKDIPVQVAIGNYDLGICGLDWLEEYRVKYPASAVVKVRHLGYGQSRIVAAISKSGGRGCGGGSVGVVRLASEYPNLAESLALGLRLRRFNIFPLWGGAEVYPPESADLVLISQSASGRLPVGLFSLGVVLHSGACLIANRDSWENRDMSEILIALEEVMPPEKEVREDSGMGQLVITPEGHSLSAQKARQLIESLASMKLDEERRGDKGGDMLWLALPDGHQQPPASQLLKRAGVGIEAYSSGNRRPKIDLPGVACKVIRPQDMPLQVANGNFALAITGRDWLTEHRCQFPTSPVKELLDLEFGWVRIVAVVKGDMPVSSPVELREWMRAKGKAPLRIATEYVNIADNYARENHLAPYRVIPTWGATEAFLPDDADLLIENTQTGRTLAEHKLKIIDTLFESTACLIGNPDIIERPVERRRLAPFIDALHRAPKEQS